MDMNVHCGLLSVCAQLLQLCLTLYNPMDCSPPDSPSVGFSRQEYWSELPCLPPEGLLDPVSSAPPASQVNSLPTEPPGKPLSVLESQQQNELTIDKLFRCFEMIMLSEKKN